MAASETAAALRAAISEFGLTQRQVAAALGVSDRMVRQVLSGNKPGRNLEAAAQQLAREGRVTEAPQRREQRVRARGGRTEPVGPRVARRVTVETQRRSQTVVEFPRRGLGREAALQAVLDDLDAHRGLRVTATVETYGGARFTIGGRRGYKVTKMRKAIEGEGDDPVDYLLDELAAAGNYGAGVLPPASGIKSVTLTYYT